MSVCTDKSDLPSVVASKMKNFRGCHSCGGGAFIFAGCFLDEVRSVWRFRCIYCGTPLVALDTGPRRRERVAS